MAAVLMSALVACDAFQLAHREFLEHRELHAPKRGWRTLGSQVPLYVFPSARYQELRWVTLSGGTWWAHDDQYEPVLVGNLRDNLSLALIWAFEAYERAIRDLSATVGHLDPSLWRKVRALKETGIGQEPFPKRLPANWFSVRLKKMRRLSAVGLIRQLLPAAAAREECWPERNFRVEIACLENLRHVLTHNHGELTLQDFLDTIATSTGRDLKTVRRNALRLVAGLLSPVSSGVYRVAWFQDEVVTKRCYRDLRSELDRLTTDLATHFGLFYLEACKFFGVTPVWQNRLPPDRW
jgi:hypothetical protein